MEVPACCGLAPGDQPLHGAPNEPGAPAIAGLEGRRRETAVIRDRDPAADGLPDKIVRELFTAGLMLQDAAELTTEPEVRWRITVAVNGLDELIRVIRDPLFNPAA